MARKRIVSSTPSEDDRQFDIALRPQCLDEFVGQTALKENLSIAIEAARKRGEALDHVLLYGPPGLGKTTLATIIANELAVRADYTSGPVLQKKLDLTGMLTTMQERQVFFIDEIHRLLADIEEMLYSSLEDFRVDLVVGTGPGARMHSIPVAPFTAIGATTRQGLISPPLRARFGITLRINPYDPVDLQRIVFRSAGLLEIEVEEDAAEEIARRSRGTPRIANRLLRRVRDYSQVRADGRIDQEIACTALDMLEVDPLGLDEVDRKIMETILAKYSGGPVGLNTISAAVGEDPSTIEEVYEPYLMQLGFLDRTHRGRVGTAGAFEYFNLHRPPEPQGTLKF
ncbi:MAG: Holliday junction branch migration DNA helicase RuvB [Bryobacterales bacterium]|nr:Holliday junction branch migration DNA helicase RuvB [Bryobacterales bacterium]